MSAARPPMGALHACSACAGDYEDPERTAGREDTSEEENEEQENASETALRDDFPVQSERPQEGGSDDA